MTTHNSSPLGRYVVAAALPLILPACDSSVEIEVNVLTSFGTGTSSDTDGPPGTCGDGQLDPGEECDHGPANAPTAVCRTNCMINTCGDGDLAPYEDCDDGAGNGDHGACKLDCTPNLCGDGLVGPSEACDDGDDDNYDECTNACVAPACGDGYGQDGEECDDGNGDDYDGCTTACLVPACGDGILHWNHGEQCDEGAENSNEGTCKLDCTLPTCGDGYVQPGEECDDGNGVDDDACTAICQPPACGDGLVLPGFEECDDGNLVDGDGCDGLCVFEDLGKVYLTNAVGASGFYAYTIASDTWETLPNPPSPTKSQITNDGERVYLLGTNNIIYSYDPAANAWAADPTPGPGASLVGQKVGYFKWTDVGFYYLLDEQTTLHHYKDGAWTTIDWGVSGSSAGSWDPINDELYIRTYYRFGFQVLDTNTDTIVRTIADVAGVTEHSRTGSLSGNFFYSRDSGQTVQKLDAVTGTRTNTNRDPISEHTATDTDPTTGHIYFSGYAFYGNKFQRYDPTTNSLTTLADQPLVPDGSTITVMPPS